MITKRKLDGPNLIFAGPGTGKTYEIVQRTIELIENNRDENFGIIICTFTVKAAEELKTRIYSQITADQADRLLINTIHAICFQLIERYSDEGYYEYSLLSEESQLNFIRSKSKNLGFDQLRFYDSEQLQMIFNKITDYQIDIDALKIDEKKIEDMAKVYPTYLSLLKQYQLFDFNTLQKAFLDLLKTNKRFKERIAKDFKYFLVDEYQDVNDIQSELFFELSSPNFNLTVVGDDDQSIYGFRGSNIECIFNFEKWFKDKGIDVKKRLLSNNYRSTESLVNFTNQIISYAPYKRDKKKIINVRKSISHEPITQFFETDKKEAESICITIKKLLDDKIITNYGQIGILFESTKYHSKQLLDELEKNKINYRLIRSGNFFDTPFGHEFYLAIKYYDKIDKEPDQNEEASDMEFIKSIEMFDVEHNTNLLTVYTDNNYLKKLTSLFLNKNKNKKQFSSNIGLLYEIFTALDIFKRYDRDGENIGAITSLALEFDDYSDFFDPYWFYQYTRYLKATKRLDYIYNEDPSAINIMTLHQAKGLQFPVVFMPQQNERKKIKSLSDKFDTIIKKGKNLEDEKIRKFYVGCTRAEDLLFISGTGRQTSHQTGELTKTKYMPNLYLITALAMNGKVTLDNQVLIKQRFRYLDEDKIKKADEPVILSYNKLVTYGICPLQYKYVHVWKLKTVRIGGMEFGTNIHNILETILNRVSDGESLGDINIDDVINKKWRNKNFVNPGQNLKFKNAATKQINTFLENQKELLVPEKILSTEEEFTVKLDSYLITGRFDATFDNNGEKMILDFKTGPKRDYSDQLSFYSLCFSEKYPKENDPELALYFLKSGDIDYVKANNPIEEKKRVKDVAMKINSGSFSATPGKHCQDCAFNKICEFAV